MSLENVEPLNFFYQGSCQGEASFYNITINTLLVFVLQIHLLSKIYFK